MKNPEKTEGKGLTPGEKWLIGTVVFALATGTYAVGVKDAVDNHNLTVKQALGHPFGWGAENVELVSTIHDLNENKQTIQAGMNARPATSEDLAKIQDNIIPSTVTEENGLQALPQFILLNPFELQDGDTMSVSLSKSKGGFDSVTGKMVEPPRVFNLEFTCSAKERKIIPGIIDPKASSFEAFKNKPFVINKEEYFGGVTIKVTRTDGSMYYVSYSSPNDVKSLNPLPILDGAPTITDKNWLLQEGVPITGVTPIMETGIDNAVISFSASEILPTETVISYSGFSEIQLFKSSDGIVLYKTD
jgi:hypothetical protein